MRRVRASIGNHILFKRNGHNILGYVVIVRQNSVVVKIRRDIAERLKYKNEFTVVNHNNYEIIIEKGTVA
ncbi:DUF2187 family protein [Niallia taxi]|uniref:DUF2187 family protein n=1 Tax=Niallia taxi TaxID=2499688 RepID=UPI003982C3D4